jgi:hypothetical protein
MYIGFLYKGKRNPLAGYLLFDFIEEFPFSKGYGFNGAVLFLPVRYYRRVNNPSIKAIYTVTSNSKNKKRGSLMRISRERSILLRTIVLFPFRFLITQD